MSTSAARQTYATTVFVMEMRRAAVSADPSRESPVKLLEEYPASQQMALVKAISMAIGAASPVADDAFMRWCARNNITP